MRMRFALIGLLVLSLASAAAALGATGAKAKLYQCPTQQQLEARGTKPGQVTSPPQMSTGTFPITSKVIVPDTECSYQGSLGLTLLFFHLTPEQQAAAQAHLSYECKVKKCTTFVSEGTSISTTVTGGKTKTSTVKTLDVIVTSGAVEGEAIGKNPPTVAAQCQIFADVLYFCIGGLMPSHSELGQLACR